MARASTQHKLDRVRPPRVHITYDVDIGGAIQQVECRRGPTAFPCQIVGEMGADPSKTTNCHAIGTTC